jgi:hypothetical protein
LDISLDAIEQARKLNLHDEYIQADIRSYPSDRKFDAVIACNMLEHLTREEAVRVLLSMEAMAQRLLYVETPRGFLEQPTVSGNPHQRHWSGWFPHDFESRGYTVFGMGVRGLRGVQGGSRIFPEPVVRSLERGLAWLVFRRPRLAFCMAAIRYVDEQGVLRML